MQTSLVAGEGVSKVVEVVAASSEERVKSCRSLGSLGLTLDKRNRLGASFFKAQDVRKAMDGVLDLGVQLHKGAAQLGLAELDLPVYRAN